MSPEDWVKPRRRDRESRLVQECRWKTGKLGTEEGVKKCFLAGDMLVLNHIKALSVVMLRSGIRLQF